MSEIYFTQNIKHLRAIKNLSQSDFAKQLGVDRTVVTNYERGVSKPTFDGLVKIALLLEVNIDDLIHLDLTGVDNAQVMLDKITPSKTKSSKDAQVNAQVNAQVSPEKGTIRSEKPYPTDLETAPMMAMEGTFRFEKSGLAPVVANAGVLGEYTQEWLSHNPEYMVLPSDMSGDIVIKVAGDSMYPLFDNGDYAICDIMEDAMALAARKPYVVVTRNSGIVLKYIEMRKDTLLLISTDTDLYPSVQIDKSDVVEVWEVKGRITRNVSTKEYDRLTSLLRSIMRPVPPPVTEG